jgi:hypothetical protein
VSRRALALRSVVLGLWAVAGLLPLLPSPKHQILPPCCRDDGRHHCSLRQRHAGGKTPAGELTASCPFSEPSTATGARFSVLQPDLPRVRTCGAAVRNTLALRQEIAPAAAVIRRASRAPPRRLV